MENVVLGEVSVRLDERVVVRPEGEASLTPREADLITYLLRNPGPVTRDELKVKVWGYHPDVQSRAVHHTVTRLRRKLELDPAEPRFLKTIRGAGYLLQGWTWAEPAASATHDPKTLPRESGPFFGRDEELARLQVLLQEVQLLTVVGTGGVGKTRLVVHAGHLRPQGAWFCALAAARDEEEVLAAVTRGLGLDGGRGSAADAVGAALKARSDCVVVLDNAEYVASIVARLIDRWRVAAPKVRFVVTSRVALGLAGERVLRVEPLAAPELEDPAAATSPAVRLLASRIRAVDPTFLAEEQVAGLVRVVRAVAGVPLALELAGSRARLLSPAQVAERLEQGLQALGRRADGPPHQRSLRATLDWSWALLDADAQRVLAQLSVFRGGFDLAAAEGVVDAPDVAGALDALVDASLVTGTGGRLALLEPIRRYASDQLGEARVAVELRHGAWFAARGTPAALDVLDWHPERWPEARLDVDNLVVACSRAVARGDTEVAVRTYRLVWTLLGGRTVVLGESVLALELEPASRGEMTRRVGWGRMVAGDERGAEQMLGEAVELCRAAGDTEDEVHALVGLAGLLEGTGRAVEARALLERAGRLARETGQVALVAMVEGSAGSVHMTLGQLSEARACLEGALGALRRPASSRTRHPARAVPFLVNLANLDRDEGRLDDAAVRYAAALRVTSVLGVGRSHGTALANRAVLWHMRGDVTQAEQTYLRAIEVLERCGARHYEAIFRGNLGELYQEAGCADQARACLQAALATHVELGNEVMVAVSRGRLGRLALEEGRLSEASDQLSRAVDVLGDRWPRATAVFRASLGEALGGQGQHQAGLQRIDQAQAVLQAEGWHRELVECLCARARVLAAAGASGARAALRRARELAGPLGVESSSVLGRDLKRTQALVEGGRSG